MGQKPSIIFDRDEVNDVHATHNDQDEGIYG